MAGDSALRLIVSPPQADEAVLLEVAAGSRAAFAELAQRYAARLASFCGKQVADTSLGEDLAQDVLVAVWEARRQFRGGDAAAWIYTFAVNRCRKQQRSWGRWLKAVERVAAVDTEAPAGALLLLEDRELVTRLGHCVTTLPPAMREALLLRFDGELDYRNIGAALGCTEGAARVRVFDAIRRLRTALSEESR